MDFDRTTLWKAAFEEPRSDSTREEQVHLADCYKGMRRRAGVLVGRIATDLPQITIHDVTHLDALWEMASIATGDRVKLNPAEAFVFGGAVLFHDAAMTLAAFPGGLSDLRQTTEWRDLYAGHLGASSENRTVTVADIEKRATEDALRLLHAKQAENLPTISWEGPHGTPMFIIEDQQIRNFYGPKIGKIAHSHWYAIAKVEDELSNTLGALPGVTNCTVDLLKLACVLRVADAMHLDQRRATPFEFALAQPKGISADHWLFQERMARPFVRGETLVYTAQPPFEIGDADAWWTAFDALQMVDQELRNVDRVLYDLGKPTLVAKRVEGVQSPRDLARTIETSGWTPVDSTIRVSDVPKIVAMLGGSKLYGRGASAPIRELIQNGIDAITARRRLQSRPSKWGELQVILDKRQDGFWFCVEDNGVGMSTAVLTGPLIDFGKSFWTSSLATLEFPGLASAGMKAQGKYGIGFFSVFILGDHVRVITRRFDRDLQSAKILEFRNGLGSRPNLRDASSQEAPLDGGTRVEVKLRTNPSEPGGVLHQPFYPAEAVKLQEVIAEIAPAVDVAVTIVQDGEIVGATKPGDWLDMESDALLTRIRPWRNSSHTSLKLAELRDEDGRLYGRARIEAGEFWWGTEGVITVGGLAANRIGRVAGILVGVETTASRNSAQPIVPAPVLAQWASEQAITIGAADLTEEDKARAAMIIMACGGDIGELPVLRWQDKWMSVAEFASAVRNLENLIVHTDNIKYDDDDNVSKRQFESTFRLNVWVACTSDRIITSGEDWIINTTCEGKKPIELIEEALLAAWPGFERVEDLLAVGEVNFTEIYREVTIYNRTASEA